MFLSPNGSKTLRSLLRDKEKEMTPQMESETKPPITATFLADTLAKAFAKQPGNLPKDIACERCGFRTHDPEVFSKHPCDMLASEAGID